LQPDEALGAYEAAALMGVHFSKPQRMAAQGLLTHKVIHSRNGRGVAVYSRRACEDNYEEYCRLLDSGESWRGQGRLHLTARPEILRLLRPSDRPRIAMRDAISVYRASEIIGVWYTRVPRMVHEGWLVGRVAINLRTPRSKFLIISEQSARENAARLLEEERLGVKLGRPRKKIRPQT